VIDGVTLEMLAPDSGFAARLDDPNAASTVVRARFGTVRVLLVGDAERDEESWLLAHDASRLAAEVLKVGHHGSRTSSTAAFLDAVRPRIALVSVGAGNGYGHPSAETLERLAERGAYILRTDQVGTAVVRTDGRRIVLDVEGGTWEPFDREFAR
jgi:competence protein ComEC